MTILVVGGAGYIGSHTLKALVRAGYESICLDDLSSGHREAVRFGVPLVVADMADAAVLRDLVGRYRVRCVIHFAARCSVPESVSRPELYYEHNVRRPLLLLETLVNLGVREFVFSSSAAVYGDPEVMPISEDHPACPVSPYGRTKLFFEQVLEDFRRAHGLRYLCLRFFNAAGADPEGELGEDHRPETHLIPRLVAAALRPSGEAEIYGVDHPTPDGTCIRDYVHVSDIAAAHVLAVKALSRGHQSGVYNLGSGTGASVYEVIRMVEGVSGSKLPVRVQPRRPGDAPALVAATGGAQEALGWRPRYSDLETIVRTALCWLQANPAGYGKG